MTFSHLKSLKKTSLNFVNIRKRNTTLWYNMFYNRKWSMSLSIMPNDKLLVVLFETTKTKELESVEFLLKAISIVELVCDWIEEMHDEASDSLGLNYKSKVYKILCSLPWSKVCLVAWSLTSRCNAWNSK